MEAQHGRSLGRSGAVILPALAAALSVAEPRLAAAAPEPAPAAVPIAALPAPGPAAPPPASAAATPGEPPEAASAARRVGKSMVLLGGVEPSYIGAGLVGSVGVYVRPDVRVELEGRTFGGLALFVYGEIQKSVAARVKGFVANSFYLAGGLRGRKLVLDNAWDTVSDGSGYEALDFGVDLGLGNEWQWENFLLGVEWLGLYRVVARDETSAHEDRGELEDFRDWADWDGRLCTFYLGASF